MLLALVAFITVFIGGISFASIIAAWNYQARQQSNHSAISPDRPLSLWSLILFLFFLPLNEFRLPKHLAPKSNRHTGNYSKV